MSEADRPRAENGAVLLGPWGDAARAVVDERWPFARVEPLGEHLTRVDLSRSERGACPGFNDVEGLRALSAVHPNAQTVGFFCDGVTGTEGVRILEGGRPRERHYLTWAEARNPDPLMWPIGRLALTLRLPVERVTRVARPPRPPLAVALEGLLAGEAPESPEVHRAALDVLGELEIEPATEALVRHLDAEDWVLRYHAVRAYARLPRGHGQEGRPPLPALLDDADEGVRESALRGVVELIPHVAFTDSELQRQIDAAAARGLEDEDEDVREAAAEVRRARSELLG